MKSSMKCWCVVILLSAVVGARRADARANVYLGVKVPASRQVAMNRVDHSAWDELLRKYVDEDGMVAYRHWHASKSDIAKLESYLKTLSTASTTARTSREAQLAFWINAYNAVTIRGILREYPTSSIRNHTAKLLGYNIWKDLQLYVGGQPYCLNQIEHEILREMAEPRIHFAIVCASIGCPRLLNEAYVAEALDKQLETNSRDFFRRSQNFRYDERNRRFYLSSILDWFGDDFGQDQAERLRTISKWLPNESAQRAAQRNAVRVSFLDYNWNLNEQRQSRPSRR